MFWKQVSNDTADRQIGDLFWCAVEENTCEYSSTYTAGGQGQSDRFDGGWISRACGVLRVQAAASQRSTTWCESLGATTALQQYHSSSAVAGGQLALKPLAATLYPVPPHSNNVRSLSGCSRF